MKIHNHKIHKPLLTLTFFVTCAVFALFAINSRDIGFAEFPINSQKIPLTFEITGDMSTPADEGETNTYPYINIDTTRVRENYTLKRRVKGVFTGNKSYPFNVGHPGLNYYYAEKEYDELGEDGIQPTNTMEMTVYANDIEDETYGKKLNLFQNVFMQNKIHYAHIYDYERNMSLDNIIHVKANYLQFFFKLMPNNHNNKEEGYFFTAKKVNESIDDDARNYLAIADAENKTDSDELVELILQESKDIVNKKIALDVFSLKSNNEAAGDTQTMRDTTIIKNATTSIIEPDVYIRYLFNIKSGKNFMNDLKSNNYPKRTIYAPDSMYFQMRLKHPAQDYLFRDKDNKIRRLSKDEFVTKWDKTESFPPPLQLKVWKEGKELTSHGFLIKNNFLHYYSEKKSKEGTYTVQLWTNKKCDWLKGENTDFCLAEWTITFLPLSKAGMLKQKELDNLKRKRYLAPNELDNLVTEEKAVMLNHISFGMDPFDPNNNAGGLNRWNIYSRFFFTYPWEWNQLEQNGSNDEEIKNAIKAGIKNNVYPFPLLPFEQSSYGWIQRDGESDYDYQSYRIIQNTKNLWYVDYLSNIVNNSGGKIKLPAYDNFGQAIYDHNAYTYKYDNKPDGIVTYNYDSTKVNVNYPSGVIYINAAGTPGQMLRLEGEASKISKGSRIYVSIWVNELSKKSTTANIGISVKTYKNGDDINDEANGEELVNYLTGFIPKWGGEDEDKNRRTETYQHPIYNPEAYSDYASESYEGQYLTSPSYVERCRGEWMNVSFSFVPDPKKLEGKDRIIVVLNNNCFNSNGADLLLDDIRMYSVKPEIKADVKESCVNTDQKERLVEAKISMKFESLLNLAPEKTGQVTRYYAFWEKAGTDSNGNQLWEPISCRYNDYQNDTESGFGQFIFDATDYKSNPEETTDIAYSYIMRHKKNEEETEELFFYTYPRATKLHSGEEYVVEFYQNQNDANNAVTAPSKVFDEADVWSKFTVKGGFRVRIDGEPVKDKNDKKIFKLGERPVITPSMEALIAPTDNDTTKYRGYFDFFNGSLMEYNDNILETKWSLAVIMEHFRADFPEADDPETVVLADKKQPYQFTKEMQKILLKEKSRFLFKKKSCTAWPLLEDEVQTEDSEPITQKLTIIPILTKQIVEKDTLICWGPYEYTLRYKGSGPTLDPGFPDVEYPEGTRGVRIGLNDLQTLVTNINKTLTIPLQDPKWTDKEDHSNVTLTSYNRKNETTAFAYLVSGDYAKDEIVSAFDERYRIATVASLSAKKDGGTNNKVILKGLKEQNLLNDTNFKFREGETYRIRIQFIEKDTKDTIPGDLYFDLKIVPEFQTWTPTDGTKSNWNNDANWKRSGKAALHKTDSYLENDDDPESDPSRYRQTSNGFVPMYFTKVTETTENPQAELYAKKNSAKQTNWYKPLKEDNYILDLSLEATKVTQSSTPNIEYELMADVKTVGSNREISLADNFTDLSCRPYYTNTCAQIHFQPNTEMLNTQYLVYGTAWIDYELNPRRWYTLSSPLKAMYAGDWYTPKKNYRQETEYFKDITFNTTTNSRINPAVYQRSWEKGRILPDLQDPVTYYANWSIVYNNVEYPYDPGIGFSVNTVVPSDATLDKKTVLFRMPKADDTYSIYDYTKDKDGIAGTPVHINKNVGYGKLKIEDAITNNSFSVKIEHTADAGENKFNHTYFLVGNPFMAHLDMTKFFAQNNGLEPKYWIVKDNEQAINIAAGTKEWIGTTSSVAPLQSFFVKAKTANTKELEVEFNTNMQILGTPAPANGSLLRSAPSSHVLTLIAGKEGKQSQALIAMRSSANDKFTDSEDAELLLDSNLDDVPTIYTVAGTQTVSINVRKNLVHIPIGIYSLDNDEIQVTLSGGADFADLSLYDAECKTNLPLVGDKSIFTLKGNCHGRYFLRGSYTATANDDILIPDAISIYSPKRGEVIVTASAPLRSILVYTLDGKLQTARQNVNTEVFCLDLPAGIYVIQATTDGDKETSKIAVK